MEERKLREEKHTAVVKQSKGRDDMERNEGRNEGGRGEKAF